MIRYHKYVGDLWEDLDLGELVGELSDFLLQSGFGDEPGEWGTRTASRPFTTPSWRR
jgi:hypothetical protein